MRIVYLADAPYPHTWRWVRHFAAAGHECHVISFRPAEIAGATVHYIDGVERLGKARYLVQARRVARLIRQLQPDLLHALHLTSYGFLGGRSGFHPFVVSVWGTDVLEAPRLTPFHRWLTRDALARADAITATGLHLALETTQYTPKGRSVTVIPYGVDREHFAASVGDSPRETGSGPGPEADEIVIGTTARLSPEKGLPYLIDAFDLLRRRYGERLHLRIAGDGPARAVLEDQIARLGLGVSVELFGWLDHEQVPQFLRGLDVFVLPSIWEGFGVSAIEASAVGLPVVASNIHGIPDAVLDGRSGLLVPPRDPNALAAAIAELVESPAKRGALGAAGREFVADNYDWHENAAQMQHLYESLTC